jgi:glycine C-acetyltransferase
MSNLSFMQDELARLKAEGLYNNIRTINSPQDAWIVVDGKRVLNLCSNNYLGLANHPKIKAAAQAAIAEWGAGPAAVRSIAGTLGIHHQLEDKLAQFKGVEATFLVQSGFMANVSTIPPVVGKEDVIYSDRLNHASIIDGSRLSGAKIIPFEHADANDLETQIKANQANFKRALMITDGVFSMDGDIAPLPDLIAVCEKYGVMSMVDDAHGEGVLGEGKGAVVHFNLTGRVDFEIGTLSKAFGAVGGYTAGTRVVCDYLRQKARPFLFSSALTAADTAACLAGVELLMADPSPVKKLWDNAKYFQAKLKSLGLDTGKTQTPITPIMLGEAERAQAFSRALFDEGIFAMAIGFPTVAKGKARIRAMISAAHSTADLDFAVEKIGAVAKKLGVI